MALHRRIPWFPLMLAGIWLAITSLAIGDMNALAMALARPSATAPAAPAPSNGFGEEIPAVGPAAKGRRAMKAPARALPAPAAPAPTDCVSPGVVVPQPG